jgi:hypothetical protein
VKTLRAPSSAAISTGAATVDQLDANLDAFAIELSVQQRAMLDEVSEPEPVTTPQSLFARIPDGPPYVHGRPVR